VNPMHSSQSNIGDANHTDHSNQISFSFLQNQENQIRSHISFEDLKNFFSCFISSSEFLLQRNVIFIEAVHQRRLEVIKCLLEKGVDIDQQNHEGKTALTLALEENNLAEVEFLLEKGAHFNTNASFPSEILEFIVEEEKSSIIASLLRDISNDTKIKEDLLVIAASKEKWEIAYYLLENGTDINTQGQRRNYTPLMCAANSGNLAVIERLLDLGAVTNVQNEEGETALMYAVENGHLEIVEYLLKQGADVNTQNQQGETALMYAIENGHLEIVKCLFKQEPEPDVNAQDEDNETVLMYAAKHGNLEIVELLLDKGARVNTQDQLGETALMHAAIHRNVAIAERLLDRGANVNAQNQQGETALIGALRQNMPEAAELLHQYGFCTNIQNPGDEAALLQEIIDLLISRGADINIQDALGETALDIMQQRR
jgi:ankyrin repeat protein